MNTELMDALNVLEKEKNIKKEVVLKAIEESLMQACKHHFGRNDNIVVTMDYETGDYTINAVKTVVENVEDQLTQISLPNARKIDKRAELGGTVSVSVKTDDFSRIAAMNAKGVILQKLRSEESRVVYDYYKQMEKDIVTGIISRIYERKAENGKPASCNVSVNLGKIEATLTPQEQVKGEEYVVNHRMKFYITEVKEGTKSPRVIISRSHPELVKRLFEAEVAELQDGVVEIKAISREPGSRTKMAVWSNDPNVDAVGACVGVNSSRVNAVVDELGGEKIDIINWDEDAAKLIENALSPSQVICVAADEEERAAIVIVPDNQLSLAIGKAGQNARLAARLTGFKIDIKSETQAIDEGLFDDIETPGSVDGEYYDDYDSVPEDGYSSDPGMGYSGYGEDYSEGMDKE